VTKAIIPKNRFRAFRNRPEFMGVALLAVIVVLNVITQQGKFFSSSNLVTIFANNTPLVILTMAQCVVLISGNIDISTGITMSLVNVWCVMMPEYYPGFPAWLAFVTGFLIAVGIGLANGFLIGFFRIPPMLATYGMSYIVRGLSLLVSDRPQGRIDRAIRAFYRADFLGVPASLAIVLVFSLAWVYMRRRPGIQEIYALGGNERNTYLTGVSTLRVTVRAYAVCGVFTGFAGLLWTAMLSSSNPISGDVKTLESIAAALLGGVLISGGWGSMICGVLGALFLALVTNTATYLFISLLPRLIPGFSLPNYYQNFVSQLIILLGIVATIMANNRAARPKDASAPKEE
jgi:ribose/xylose/arabinose/galactoside ABC-type transport system permease subunit